MSALWHEAFANKKRVVDYYAKPSKCYSTSTHLLDIHVKFIVRQRLFLRQAPNMPEPTSRYCKVRFVWCLWSREYLPSTNSSFGDVITTLNSISTALISIHVCTSKYLSVLPARVFFIMEACGRHQRGDVMHNDIYQVSTCVLSTAPPTCISDMPS